MDPKFPEANRLPPDVEAHEGRFRKLANVNFETLVVQDARVFKAGNSLAIRIPSAIAKHIALEDGTSVELAVDQGMIYVRKAPSRSLAELIERITAENLHAPMFDDLTGAERW